MRKLILAATCLLLTVTANAGPTDEEKQYCAVLGQYSWLIANGRFGMGLTKEQQWPSLRQLNQIPTSMEADIDKVINLVYQDDMPMIKDAASIAAFTDSVYRTCLREIEDR